MKEFVISGNVKLGSQMRNFNKTLKANDEEHARELIMCIIGSKHGLARRFINILEVLESGEMEGSVVLPNQNVSDEKTE